MVCGERNVSVSRKRCRLHRRTRLGSHANLKKLIVLVCLLLSAACAKPAAETKQAEAQNQPPASATNSQSQQIKSTDVVKVTPQELTLAKGQSDYAIVRLQIQNG